MKSSHSVRLGLPFYFTSPSTKNGIIHNNLKDDRTDKASTRRKDWWWGLKRAAIAQLFWVVVSEGVSVCSVIWTHPSATLFSYSIYASSPWLISWDAALYLLLRDVKRKDWVHVLLFDFGGWDRSSVYAIWFLSCGIWIEIILSTLCVYRDLIYTA